MGSKQNEMKDNLLSISWHDSAWIPILNGTNVLDYFSERSNPFYDRTCNNEIVKMQRLSPEQLNNMTGLEYILLHVQEPILYVIRKQHRHSPVQALPLADYYIIAGVVYQAPDLAAVVNSRLLNSVNHLQSAFDECVSYSRYHPSRGYWWEFKDKEPEEKKKKEKKEEPSSLFQRKRVDLLLLELVNNFPPKAQQDLTAKTLVPSLLEEPKSTEGANNKTVDTSIVKIEKADTPTNGNSTTTAPVNPRMKPPPEKRARLN